MGSFISLDRQELLDGELGVRESGSDKIAFFKLGKSFSIKLGLELFQNIREFCKVIESTSARAGHGYDQKHETGTKKIEK